MKDSTFKNNCCHLLRVALLATAIAALQGCASTSSQSIQDRERSSLIVVRSGNEVKMSWNSQPDRIYTILYSMRRNARGNEWLPLKGYVNMRGTGGTMRASHQVPIGKEYFYRLRSTEM